MKISEKKVIDKIITLASSIVKGESGDTDEEKLRLATSNCSQIVAICELLEFEENIPSQTMSFLPEVRGVDADILYQTPSDVTDLFRDAMKEQGVRNGIPQAKVYE